MPPQRSSRAGSAAQSSHNSNRSVVKRDGSDSPIYLASTALVTPEEAKQARKRFFDALGEGVAYPGMRKAITSADQLTEVQLKRCFDILHACGSATDVCATLVTTRASVDGFLDAVFHDWNSDKEGDLVKPELEFMVEAECVAGIICTTPDYHHNISACRASDTCTAAISAIISYSCNPAMLKMEFTMVDPFTGQSEAFCPLGRADIRWAGTQWRQTLRHAMESRLISKVHRYNKHLAVWHARKLILSWSKGGVCLGPEVGKLGFMRREAVSFVLVALGEPECEM